MKFQDPEPKMWKVISNRSTFNHKTWPFEKGEVFFRENIQKNLAINEVWKRRFVPNMAIFGYLCEPNLWDIKKSARFVEKTKSCLFGIISVGEINH